MPPPKYHHGEFVDVLFMGDWQVGVVQGLRFEKGFKYRVMLIDKVKTVVHPERDLCPSEKFKMDLETEMNDDMVDLSQETSFKVPVSSQAPWKDGDDFIDPAPMFQTVYNTEKDDLDPAKDLRSADVLQILTKEEQKIAKNKKRGTSSNGKAEVNSHPDITEKQIPTKKPKGTSTKGKPEVKSHHKSSRFLDLLSQEIDDIQLGSKSAKTLKHTKWGLNQLKGKCFNKIISLFYPVRTL